MSDRAGQDPSSVFAHVRKTPEGPREVAFAQPVVERVDGGLRARESERSHRVRREGRAATERAKLLRFRGQSEEIPAHPGDEVLDGGA